MPFSLLPLLRLGRFSPSGLLVVGLATAGVAGAASIHRFAVSQTTGSEGATTFLQTGGASTSALQANVATAADTGVKLPFAMLGEYAPGGTTFGIGVAGVSTTGYAVAGEALGVNPAMYATNVGTGDGILSYTASGSGGAAYAVDAVAQGAGDGVDGVAENAGWGGYFSSATGIGVQGTSYASGSGQSATGVFGYQGSNGVAGYFESSGGNAIHAIADSSSGAGVLGDDSVGSRGILGDNTGEAVVGFGHAGNAHAAITALDAVGGTRLFAADAYDGGKETPSFIIQSNTANRSGNAVESYSTDVQASGDLYVYGQIFQDCEGFPATSSTRCEPVTAGGESTGASVTRSATGTDVRMFAARQSLPTVEDEGTAQLVNGRAYVRLDAAFAQTMSMERPYRVYVTPAGPSRGVYVTNRTPQGFEVDENPGGRSSVAFDYRIVGAPFGDRSQRLAVAPKKIAQRSAPDPQFAELRTQAAGVRSFDLAGIHAQSRRILQRHTLPKPAVSLVKRRTP